MKRTICAVAGAAATSLVTAAAPATAQDGWNITVSPRSQYIFLPGVFDGNDEIDTSGYSSYGGTLSVRRGRGRLGLEVTGLFASSDGDLENQNAPGGFSQYDYETQRFETSGHIVYRPEGASNIAFLTGLRVVDYESSVFTDNQVNNEYSLDNQLILGEVGLRMTALAAPGSRHAFVTNALLGAGVGTVDEASETNSIDGRVFDDERNALALNVEFAVGYNFVVSQKATIGARLRGVVGGVDIFGEGDISQAFGPEVNVSYRF